jgi:16S rRNA processing protein RimM
VRVVVGRLGRAHGIRGDLSVEVRTDSPDRRFAPGAVLFTESPSVPRLVVEDARWHSGRLLVHLVGVDDRTQAEALRGLMLEAEVPDDEVPDAEDEYFDRQLVGLTVVMGDGAEVGTIREVVHLPSQDLLVVDRDGRPDALVPFVTAIVPEVDLVGRRVVIEPPPGLLDEAEGAEEKDGVDEVDGADQ